MKITQSKEKDLSAKLIVDVTIDDYNEKVLQTLNDYRKKAVIPGFRKGKTPMTIINKKYRSSVVVEEVNKIIQDALYKYISENKVRVLGSPIPLDNNKIDWENSQDFKFEYEIALAPDFDVKISKKDKLIYYKINPDKKIIESYCIDIAKKYGKMTNPEKSKDGDLVFCSIHQLDMNGDIIAEGVTNEATVSMDFIKDDKIKKKFIGVKKDDVIILDVLKGFPNQVDLASMLKISQEELKNLNHKDFKFIVKNVNRLNPAELDVDLFNKIYGVGEVSNVKEFRERIKKDLEKEACQNCLKVFCLQPWPLRPRSSLGGESMGGSQI